MIPSPICSVIIPTYNHAKTLPDAIDSVLAQSVPCEAIIVDDGSSDHTAKVLARYGTEPRVRLVTLTHGGPARARNAGLEVATRPYVMFLDADDTLERTKVERQRDLLQASPDTGWVICDVQIDDAGRGESTTASARYGYATKDWGWIHQDLAQGNFIPIMAPLIRRSAIPAWLRFDEHKYPEDWHFWTELSALARVRYVPAVLATYRKSRTGRHALPKAAREVYPTITHPLRLNLGCGHRGTATWHPIPGMVNLDRSLGWEFADGLKDFADRSVAAITISHALMYYPEEGWPAFFDDVARVLVEGGIIRITEDLTDDPKSRAFGGWKGSEPFVTLTTPTMLRRHLERVGLLVHSHSATTSGFVDASLLQQHHGDMPDVFFMEGQNVCGVLFAPHCDDEVLFAAFTLLRHRPRVVVCYPSTDDYGDTARRREETRRATTMLGCGALECWEGGDLESQMRDFDRRANPTRVWAPSVATSHPDHLAVAKAAAVVFGDRLTQYHTYQDGQKVRLGTRVPFELEWVSAKLRALSGYHSQIDHPRANQFFTWDLLEYQVPR